MSDTKKGLKMPMVRKLILLGAIVLGVIIWIIATYVTEYNMNKVSVEKAYESTIQETWVEVSEEDFMKHFTTFSLTESKYIEPIFKGDGSVKESGSAELTLYAEYNTSISKKEQKFYANETFKVYAKYAANWIGYYSNQATWSSYQVEKTTNAKITGIDQLFPVNRLLFVTVEAPELFVLITWSDDNNVTNYTLLSLDQSVYTKTE